MEKKVRMGLEVHCQLTSLKTKLFCACPADYRDSEPNSHICPICGGLPGTLPTLNRRAIKDALKVAITLHSTPSDHMTFYRKNYFYPDMPKNFQISQYDKAGGVPLAVGGYVSLTDEKTIRIKRIHLEEDPAKLVYEGTITSSAYTLVDYNRAGVALTEIVTEPDMNSPKEARDFLQRLRSILEHIGVCDGSLEGSMRCDANISLSGGRRVEIKNISSFKEVERALSFEITRQNSLLSRRIEVETETRHWDEVRRVTVSLRVKEEEKDYRYFPEPDLPPVVITRQMLREAEAEIPELPDHRERRFIKNYGLSPQIAKVLISDKVLADFFEEAIKLQNHPRMIGGWLAVDVIGYKNRSNSEFKALKVTPKHLSELARLVEEGKVSESAAKGVLMECLAVGTMPAEVISRKGLAVMSDMDDLMKIVGKIFEQNEGAVRDALTNPNTVNFLVGQVMKETRGKADPLVANQAVKECLSKMKP